MGSNEGTVAMMILRLQSHFPMRVTDWLLACITLSWGVSCWNISPEIWNASYMIGIRRMADNETWATAAIFLGTARLMALVINGAVRRSPHVRGAGAFLTCFLWCNLALGMMAAGEWTFMLALSPWFLIADLYNVYRAAQDARTSDTRAKAGAVRNASTAR